ncbi:EF-hand domain-containing protein [uncultured Oxalicibacterium sp.]|uniref:EF-hand domain-containing protein n=1 Tax=uncultured Oxalicibacterium sp. TaxID=1168540 RepID=UPI0025DA3C1A|nr:EF-hand domain-containing protein [uncultured Oxalicibacterium sp.]
MIGSVQSGINSDWSTRKSDSVRSASELLSKVADVATDERNGVTAGRNATDASADPSTVTGERKLTEKLAAQRDQTRFANEDKADQRTAAQNAFSSIDTENKGYIDRASLKAALDEMSKDKEANAQAVEQIFKQIDTDGNDQISESEFTTAVEQTAQQDAADPAAASAGTAPPLGGVPPAGGGSTASKDTEPADTNKDGSVSLQELMAYQRKQAEAKLVEENVRQQTEATNRIATQLAQTYGRFDAEVANATVSGNVFSATA